MINKLLVFFFLLCGAPLLSSHFLLMGAPGSGKGTFAQFLDKEASSPYTHLCVGDLLRAEVKAETAVGLEIKESIRAGLLVPNEITFTLVRARLEQAFAAGESVILDGLVQNQDNIDFFNSLLDEWGSEQEFQFVYLSIPEEIAKERLLGRALCTACGQIANLTMNETCPACGGALEKRFDDSLATIERRLNRFYNSVEPLIAQYQGRENFYEFDSTLPLEEKYALYREQLTY